MISHDGNDEQLMNEINVNGIDQSMCDFIYDDHQPVRQVVNDRGLFTAGWFGVREKHCSWLEIYDRLRASEQAAFGVAGPIGYAHVKRRAALFIGQDQERAMNKSSIHSSHSTNFGVHIQCIMMLSNKSFQSRVRNSPKWHENLVLRIGR